MADNVQRHAFPTDVAESNRGAFSGVKGLVDFFSDEAPNVTSLKVLTTMDTPMAESYVREAYLAVIILLISDRSI